MKQVLVTTGATVTFEGLIVACLDQSFLNELLDLGYDRLVLQYGQGDEGIRLVADLIQQLESLVHVSSESQDPGTGHTFELEYVGQGCSKSSLCIKCIQFDGQLTANFTRYCDLVISHAGTGSIMDALRTRRAEPEQPCAGSEPSAPIALIVMINSKLQDNHQEEIARAFESLGVLTSVKSDVAELTSRVRELSQPSRNRPSSVSARAEPNRLGPASGAIIGTIVAEELSN